MKEHKKTKTQVKALIKEVVQLTKGKQRLTRVLEESVEQSSSSKQAIEMAHSKT